jgi:hypothetical protein
MILGLFLGDSLERGGDEQKTDRASIRGQVKKLSMTQHTNAFDSFNFMIGSVKEKINSFSQPLKAHLT